MTITLYGISNCDTVKRARAWLDEHGVGHAFHDYKKAGVPPERLDAWIAALGWERLVNRSGTTWRKLDEDTRSRVHGQCAGVDARSAERHPAAGRRMGRRRHVGRLRRRRVAASVVRALIRRRARTPRRLRRGR
jgi:hypothetical protein